MFSPDSADALQPEWIENPNGNAPPDGFSGDALQPGPADSLQLGSDDALQPEWIENPNGDAPPGGFSTPSDLNPLYGAWAASRGQDPDRTAKVLSLALKAGLPALTVERNLQEVETLARDVEPEALDQFASVAPKASAWLSKTPDNFAMSRDDLGNIASFEALMAYKNPGPAVDQATSLDWIVRAGGQTLESSVRSLRINALRVKQLYGDASPGIEAAIRRLKDQQPDRVKTDGLLQDSYINFLEIAPQFITQANDRIRYGLMGAVPGAALGTAAGGVGAIPGAVAGFAVGQNLGGARNAFEMEAGAAYDEYRELRDERGQPLDDRTARLAAVLVGVVNGGIEFAQMNLLLKMTPGGDAIRTMLTRQGMKEALTVPAIRTALTNFAKNLAGGWTLETGQEVLQEAVTFLGRQGVLRVNDQATDSLEDFTQRMADTAYQAGTGMLPLVGFHASLGLRGDMRRARAAKTDARLFEALDDNAKASKLRARMPEAYQDLVSAVTKDGSIEAVHVDASAFQAASGLEGDTLYQLLDQIGVRREDFDQAADLGADIAIPLDRYQARLAGTDVSLALRPDLKFQPDGMTLREQAEFEKTFSERVQTAQEALRQDAQGRAELDQAVAGIEQKLTETGYNKEEAANAAQLLKQRAVLAAAQWSAVTGEAMTPAQWITDHLGLRVETMEPGAKELGAEPSSGQSQLFQPSRRDVRLADEALASDVAAWAESVDALGERSSRDNMTMLNQTPLVLQMLGANNLSVQISPGKLSTAMEKHGLSPELVKQVPGAMADPVMVFRSATQGGDMVMMLELKDQQGGTVVVPITLEKETPGGYSANIVTSVYGKTDQETRQPINVWFARQIESGNLLYRNNKKSRDWARTSRLRLPGANSRAITAGQRIYTDTDLVKLREANPTLYQDKKKSRSWANQHGLQLPPGRPRNSSGHKIYSESDLVNLRADGAFYQNDHQNPGARGSVTFSPHETVIRLFKGTANFSTFLHESAHVFIKDLEAIVATGKAPAQVVQDLEALKAFAGDLSTVAAQEKVARAFEAYLMEGRAPSLELRGAFQRFRAWLTAIYRTARQGLGVDLTGDVRMVFDRMLAAENEITEAEAYYSQKEDLAAVAGDMLTEAEKKRLAGTRAKAHVDALEARVRQYVKAYFSAIGGKAAFEAEARVEVSAQPVYAAVDQALAEGGMSKADLIDRFGEAVTANLTRKRVGLVRLEADLDLDQLAWAHGFESAAELVQAIQDAPAKRAAVAALVQQRMGAKEQTIRAEFNGQVKPGDEDYHSAERLEVLLAENKILERKLRGRALAAQNRSAQLTAAAVREVAHEAVRNMTTRQARDYRAFAVAEARAGQQAMQAAKAGDWEEAARQKQREALNHAMVLEAVAAREALAKTLKKIGKVSGQKTLLGPTRELVTRLTVQYGLRPYKGLTGAKAWTQYHQDVADSGKGLPSLGAWVASMDALGYTVPVDAWVGETANFEAYEDMTVARFESVKEALDALLAVDRNERTALKEGKRIALETIEADLEAAAAKNGKAKERPQFKKEGLKDTLHGLHAIHAKVEVMLLALDGWTHGAWWDYVFRPIAEAEDARSKRMKQEALRVKEVFKGYKDDHAGLFNKRVLIKGISEPMTKSQILSAVLNMGNESSLARLREGYGWGNAQIEALKGQLDAKDWRFVQDVWRHVESFRQEAFALQSRMTGVEPTRIKPITIQTKFGDIEGGYYPAKYNRELSFKAYVNEQKEHDKSLFGGRNHGAAMTRHGHLKERSSSGGGQKIALDLSVYTDHIFEVVHDLTHREAVVDVAKIIRSGRVRQAMETYLGREEYREMMPWLLSISGEQPAPTHQIHRWANWARKGATIMNMGWKITTMVTQPLGYLQTVEVLGKKYAAIGLKEVYANPLKTAAKIEEIFAKSTFMAERIKGGYDRDARDATKGMTALGGKLDAVRRTAFLGIGAVQMGVDLPTWTGAYRKALAEGKNEKTAVAEADSVVRLSQGHGSEKDLARVQRGGELERLFTMFYSYFNALYNLAYRRSGMMHGVKDIPAAAASALRLWILPSVLSELVAGRGPDDDEDWIEWALPILALYPMQMFVGVRDVANGIFGDYGYQITPAQSAPASMVKWTHSVQKAFEENEPEKLVKPTVELIGYAFQLPLKQVVITAGNVWDYATGETPDFELRDLLFTKQKSRRP